MSVSVETVTQLENIQFLIENCCDYSFLLCLKLISGYISSFCRLFCYFLLQQISYFVYFNILI